MVFIIAILAITSGTNRGAFLDGKGRIAVVPVEGVITDSREVVEQLDDFRLNDSVAAVVVRIDSPGGAVAPSQEIYDAVKRLSEKKPVVASMGSMGASGGYYAALGADNIIANPGTMTGSIGVIVKFPNLEGLYEKIGYKSEVIKSGPLKGIGASNRALSEEERKLMQDLIKNVYKQFVRDVAAARSMPEETISGLADGRIYTGEQALEAGLIDSLGNFTDAIAFAADLVGLDTKDPHLIYPRSDKRFSLFNLLTSAEQSIVDTLVPFYPILSFEWRGVQ